MLPILSDKTGHQSFQPDYKEPIQVVQEFDPQLKFVTFTVHRDPLKSAFEVLINGKTKFVQ
jgi:hypothetical protein